MVDAYGQTQYEKIIWKVEEHFMWFYSCNFALSYGDISWPLVQTDYVSWMPGNILINVIKFRPTPAVPLRSLGCLRQCIMWTFWIPLVNKSFLLVNTLINNEYCCHMPIVIFIMLPSLSHFIWEQTSRKY